MNEPSHELHHMSVMMTYLPSTYSSLLQWLFQGISPFVSLVSRVTTPTRALFSGFRVQVFLQSGPLQWVDCFASMENKRKVSFPGQNDVLSVRDLNL